MRTYEHLMKFTGKRYQDNQEISTLCAKLDEISCRDLTYILTALSAAKAEDWDTNEALQGNQFHEVSSISQRQFHEIEKIFYDALPNTEFVELSPLQPFGLTTVFTDISGKNVVSALKRSEVNADISTALFRVAFNEFVKQRFEGKIRRASHTRITRAMSFEKQSKFLPHFRMFGQVTVGRETDVSDPSFGPEEMKDLVTHLIEEVNVLDTLTRDVRFNLSGINVEISNVAFISEMIDSGIIDRAVINRETINPEFDAFSHFGINLPRKIPLNSIDLMQLLDVGNLNRGRSALIFFLKELKNRSPNLFERASFRFNRIAGAGYYKTLCYGITGTDSEGVITPLVDGGTTSWAKTASQGSKRAYVVSSGIGTELLGQYFMRK